MRHSCLYRISILNCGDSITEEQKHAILFSATILAARKLAEIGDKPCPAREICIEDAIRKAELILDKIDKRWPAESGSPSHPKSLPDKTPV